MFNILSHKGNVNQNDTEIPFHPSQNGYHLEKKQPMLVRMRRGKKKLLCTVGENVSATTVEIRMEVPQTATNRTTI
jgi:hypothetical protein